MCANAMLSFQTVDKLVNDVRIPIQHINEFYINTRYSIINKYLYKSWFVYIHNNTYNKGSNPLIQCLQTTGVWMLILKIRQNKWKIFYFIFVKKTRLCKAWKIFDTLRMVTHSKSDLTKITWLCNMSTYSDTT